MTMGRNARRDFGKQILIGAASIAYTMASGCSIASVEQTIENFAPVILNAVAIIAGLIPGASAALSVIALIKIGVADLLAAVEQWKSAPGTNTLGKISAALEAVIANFQNLLTQIPGATLPIQLITVIVSTLAGLAMQLAPSAARIQLRPGIAPQRRSLAEFKRDFNAALVAGSHPELQLK